MCQAGSKGRNKGKGQVSDAPTLRSSVDEEKLTEGDGPHYVFIPDAMAADGLVFGDILFYMLSLIYY